MLEPLGGGASMRLVDGGKAWRDTGTRVDERQAAQPDTLWDGVHLYIVSAGTSRHRLAAARLIRLQLQSRRSAGSASIRTFRSGSPTRGSTRWCWLGTAPGKLWTVYVADDGVTVNQTLGGDLFWGKPSPLPVQGSLVHHR